jgi:tRNA dimethylallyltransferase
MVEAIKKDDPNAVIDFNNQRRIESAYRVLVSGHKRSEKLNKDEPLYDIFLIYLDIDRVTLKMRLALRLEEMIEKGFIEETKNLMSYELNIIGYREIKAYLNDIYTLDEAKEKIIASTMRFAKRQKTWFLNQMQPHVYDASNPNLTKTVIDDINVFLGVKK